MGHSLVYVMIDAASAEDARKSPDNAVMEPMAPFATYGTDGDADDYLLENDNAPLVAEEDKIVWRMTHRQARLELLCDPELKPEMTPDVSMDRLVELLIRDRRYHGEDYQVSGEMITCRSRVQPYPKFDWYVVGGRWSEEYALPPPWDRPEVTRVCSNCRGEGLLPAKSYLLPRFLRLSAAARADTGERATCPRCEGQKSFTYPEPVEDPPQSDFVKTIPETLALIDYDDELWPWALVDLDGNWHGPWGGISYGVSEESNARDILENTVLRHLNAAPEGTVVVAVDVHM